ncbi:hypothetical protein, partial [Corynebacterium durum]|uniref:hypothetical protein n=1 Tax=Corynebacterium durum TaxID=61592 RepID=UPI0026DC1D99
WQTPSTTQVFASGCGGGLVSYRQDVVRGGFKVRRGAVNSTTHPTTLNNPTKQPQPLPSHR